MQASARTIIFEVWLNGRARRLGRWGWRFDSSHLDEVHRAPRARPASVCLSWQR